MDVKLSKATNMHNSIRGNAYYLILIYSVWNRVLFIDAEVEPIKSDESGSQLLGQQEKLLNLIPGDSLLAFKNRILHRAIEFTIKNIELLCSFCLFNLQLDIAFDLFDCTRDDFTFVC